MVKYLRIGKIINTHGVKGELKILPLTDESARFLDLKWVYLERNLKDEKLHLDGVKFLKDNVIIKFKEINDMTSAENLKGLYILIDRENAIALPSGSYFVCDLIDCQVFEQDGVNLGTIKEILKTGSNDVYVVNKPDGSELLIPALKTVVKSIDVLEKKIIVSLPEGL